MGIRIVKSKDFSHINNVYLAMERVEVDWSKGIMEKRLSNEFYSMWNSINLQSCKSVKLPCCM